MYDEVLTTRISFDIFRSEMCHILKEQQDYGFIKLIVLNNWIETFWSNNWFPECFYTLAMVDYLSYCYNAPQYDKYNKYRSYKLKELLYSRDMLLLEKLNPDKNIREKLYDDCMKTDCGPFFLKYNIMEGDIRDVI